MAARSALTSLKLADLEESVRVNVRAGLNEQAIEDYQHAYENGAAMPPVVVFQAKGTERYILADGRHRKAAAVKAGLKKLDVELREGDETDALKYALTCNTMHGVRRTGFDLKIALRLLMQNKRLTDEYRTTADKAELMHCSERTVHRLLAEWRDTETPDPVERSAKEQARDKALKFTPEKPAKARNGSEPKALDDDTADIVEAIDVISGIEKFEPKKLAASGAFSVRTVRKVADRIFGLLEQLE
jgi:ParB-like chromosome segregation protein Spo0J